MSRKPVYGQAPKVRGIPNAIEAAELARERLHKRRSETATKYQERLAAQQYAERKRLYQGVEVCVSVPIKPLVVPKPPYQRPVFDAPGCVVREHLTGERLA